MEVEPDAEPRLVDLEERRSHVQKNWIIRGSLLANATAAVRLRPFAGVERGAGDQELPLAQAGRCVRRPSARAARRSRPALRRCSALAPAEPRGAERPRLAARTRRRAPRARPSSWPRRARRRCPAASTPGPAAPGPVPARRPCLGIPCGTSMAMGCDSAVGRHRRRRRVERDLRRRRLAPEIGEDLLGGGAEVGVELEAGLEGRLGLVREDGRDRPRQPGPWRPPGHRRPNRAPGPAPVGRQAGNAPGPGRRRSAGSARVRPWSRSSSPGRRR